MAELECRACLGPMPPADGQGRPRTWCSDWCRREVWKWRRQEGMKRDQLTLMRAIEDLSGPTTHTAFFEYRYGFNVSDDRSRRMVAVSAA